MSAADVAALNARVVARLAAEFPGIETGQLEVLPGGHSGLTYRLPTGTGAVVIKAVPPGRPAVGRHDMLRQARILAALTGSAVPVPALIATDEGEPAWFAMAWANGQAIEPVLDGVELPPGLARSRAFTAASVLAQLHRIDPAVVTGAALDAVSLTDELAKWTAVLHAGPEEFVPRGAVLADSLASQIPAPIGLGIVHGDFRLGNILFDGTGPQALVDWEIWGIGDPRVDLGYFAVFVDHRNFPQLGTEVSELPSEAELVEAYAAASGAAVADATWFQALGRFKMAAIMAHNLRRHREGRHDDPVQESLPPTIRALTETGLELATRTSASN
jgi:aminoglycoside phosphotransferase (APT) family kinase protein